MKRRPTGVVRWLAGVAAVLAAVLAMLWAWPQRTPPSTGSDRTSVAASDVLPVDLAHPASEVADGRLDWLVVGGGATPSSNQYGIEADVQEVVRTFSGPGRVWFSGGAEALAVQVRQARPRGDPLRRRLGRFFWPRQGRDARYRKTHLPRTRVAERPVVLDALTTQLRHAADGPLLVWIAGHGDLGERPADSGVQLWGGGRLLPRDLARLLDGAGLQRTMTVLMTTCYSGGFAEMVFDGADHRRGAARVMACGLFAAPWDLESSGCDANPDRRQHEGYARHFLSGLRGLDRNGRRLPRPQIDFDGDGRISLLEAHTRVRIASSSADVPTSTSERWLRHVAPDEGPIRDADLPEERAVISHLRRRLRLDPNIPQAKSPLAAREAAIAQAQEAVDLARADEDAAWHTVAAHLLGRWPVLDDPWHPDFDATLSTHHRSIGNWLDGSPKWRSYTEAVAVTDAANRLLDEARIAAALAERLERAQDNLRLAARLTAAGGAGLVRWQALLRCERRVPRLRAPDTDG